MSTTAGLGIGASGESNGFLVSGQITWTDGSPVVGVVVRAVDEDLRVDQSLGPYAPAFREETRTDASGRYSISYSSTQFANAEIESADLVVRALGADGGVVANSPTLFNAPAHATIDLTISGPVAGQPSEYERLIQRIRPLLVDAQPPEVTALRPTDIDFLVGETGWERALIGDLLGAVGLWNQAPPPAGTPTGVDTTGSAALDPAVAVQAPGAAAGVDTAGSAALEPAVAVQALYGLLREGLPSAWTALLQLGAVTLAGTLVSAAQAAIIALEFEQNAQSIATELLALAARQALATGGSSGVAALLGAGNLSGVQQQTLLTVATTATGTSEQFWSELASQPGFGDAADVARLQLTLQLGLLTGNHPPLVGQILSDGSVTRPQDLVSWDAAAWTKLLSEPVDGQPVGIPAGVPGDTPAEQQANYVRGIMATLQSAFPNETVAHLIASDTSLLPEAATRSAVAQFFANSPDFDIRTTRISAYVAAAGGTALKGIPAGEATAVVEQLQRLQRAFQISVSAEAMTALLGLDLDAAHLVADIPRQTFLGQYADALGGQEVAQAVYERATFINARSVGLIAQMNDLVNGLWPKSLTGGAFGNGSGAAKQQLTEAYPDLSELFGALDPCNCEDCTSVLSPTAYFVDLLQFLKNSGKNAAGNTPLDVLIGRGGSKPLAGRRPDLAHLKLTCENTNTELPYIDLVNEVLESYIYYNGPSSKAAHNTGEVSTPELDANPQHTLSGRPGPYYTLANAVYPFTLPYTRPIATARAYLKFLGSSRYQVLDTFQVTPAPAQAAIDAEYLGIDPYLYQLLTGQDLQGETITIPTIASLYGFSPAETGWESDVSSVPSFLARTGIQIGDLTALLQTALVNPAYPAGGDLTFFDAIPFDYGTLMSVVHGGFRSGDPTVLAELANAGISGSALTSWWGELEAWWERNADIGELVVIDSPQGSCDISDATLAQLENLSAPLPDRQLDTLQLVIRLWQATGWSVADLDRAFTALLATPVSSAGSVTVAPGFIHDLARIQQLQATLEPPVLQMLLVLWGNLDPNGSDSLYRELFLDPAALPNDSAFEQAQDGAVLQDPSQTISGHVPALVAGLRVSADDLSLIRADAGLTDSPAPTVPAPLTLANVSKLCRYAVLAQALEMSVPDFIALRALAGPALDPFVSPDTALKFVTLAQDVQRSGITATQLAYLYEHVSTPPTGLAPQQTALLVQAQALRAGLAQIATQCAIAPDPKGTLTASAITQLVSKIVAAETVALVNGTAVYSAPLAALPAGIARLDGGGNVTGVDPTKTPAAVGAKLSYDPSSATLAYAGAMTSAEQAVLAPISSDTGYQSALASLYEQPVSFLADNLAPLLDDPTAEATLLRTTASLDGQLNAVLVDGGAQTEIAVKFAYLLGKLLPYLQNVLSHTFVKQTIADTFTLDPTLTSLLLEQILSSPTTSGQPVIDDLLALGDNGVSASYYASADLSGAPTQTTTVAQVDFDGTTSVLPAGTRSASFACWFEVPASATFTFQVQSTGTPTLLIDGAALGASTPSADIYSFSTALTAGTLVDLTLELENLPASATATLIWQSATTPSAPIVSSAQLPDAAFASFCLAYVRIQKAALICDQFALSAPEIQYLTSAGASGLFAGFDLNALPLTAGTTTTSEATALFAVWPRLFAYTTLRNALPSGSVSLIDLFTAPTFATAAGLVSQATGWAAAIVEELLTAFFPTAPATGPNLLVEETSLMPLQACVNLVQQTGASPSQLLVWAQYSWAGTGTTTSAEATFDGLNAIAVEIQNTAALHYDAQSWLPVAEQLSNTLRASQRSALVAYLLGSRGWTDPDLLFDLLLIDPEMGTCMQTSRVRQALNSVQLFVQRCLLNLEAGSDPDVGTDPAAIVAPSQIDSGTWREWMGSYSLWAANREVFLFPENWLLPSLRDDQTPIFETFASSLQQGTITNQGVSEDFLAYLQGLEQIDRLDIRAVLRDGGVTHVVGRTFHTPHRYYYRREIDSQGWTPWEEIGADIAGDHLVPAIYEGRLRLIWPVFTQQTNNPPQSGQLTSGSGINQTPQAGDPPQNYWQITLAWTECYQGAWQPKNVTDDFLISYFSAAGSEMTLKLSGGQSPRVGDEILGITLEEPCTVTAVSGHGPYKIRTSQSIPATSSRVFAGGPKDIWSALSYGYTPGSDEVSFNTLGATPQVDDAVVGDGLPAGCAVTKVSTSAPYTLTLTATMPKDIIGGIAGGPYGAWVGFASAPGPPYNPNPQQPRQSAHVFKARIEDSDLVVDVYAELTTNPGSAATKPLLLGEFRFSACGDSVQVGYDTTVQQGYPTAAGVAKSLHQSDEDIGSSTLIAPPGTDVYFNGFQQQTASDPDDLKLWKGGFGDDQFPAGDTKFPSSSLTYLKGSPQAPFQLRCSQQDWQFAAQQPFFYQDKKRTFYVEPTSGAPLRDQLSDASRIDIGVIFASNDSAATAGLPKLAAAGVRPGAAIEADTNLAAVASAPSGAGEAQMVLVDAGSLSSRAGADTSDAAAVSAGVGPVQLRAPHENWAVSPHVIGTQAHKPTVTLLSFFTHRHPYVCNLIEALVEAQGQEQSGGIDGLLNIANQQLASTTFFETDYKPNSEYVAHKPTETIDFSATGAYSDYNWELFFHAPLLVALTLSQNQQFQDADAWFRYIFDPTDAEPTVASPDRYWQVQPFREGVPQTLLALMEALDASSGSAHDDALAQYKVWQQDPFNPFAIARLRTGAFQKYVFMAYLDNLIAWGDQLYGQVDTIESINQATQLYVFASELLGELPQQIPSPHESAELSYSQIQSKLDKFSNFAETIENEFPYAGGVSSNSQSKGSGLLGVSKLLFFCIPQNQQLLQYWTTVSNRLYNIRNCLNIQGVPQQLALFQPPANPLLLIEAAAEGIDPGSVLADVNAGLPNYRFSYLIAKAVELTNACQTFGREFLEALEKNDAEGLALLRAKQETAILTLMHDQKQQQVSQAQANVQALYASRNVAVSRYNYYQQLLGSSGPTTPAVGASIPLATIASQPSQSSGGVQLISEELSELSLSNEAALLHAGAGLLQTLASVQATIPTVGIGVAAEPFGVGGTVDVSFGGSNLAASTEAVVHGLETAANYITYQAWSAGKMGGYFRRQQEWGMQSNIAAGEIMQIDQQINAANIMVTIAADDLSVNEAQTANAQKVQEYLTNKFTSQQLYGWMIGQTSSLYSQLYQLAYSTAKLAEVAYQRELAVPDSNYVTFGYWDSLRQGLLSGERLQLGIRQLEQAYIAQNQREFEITRHISLLLHDPAALMALKTTGECVVEFPEQLFDMDYPGQYLRRLRDVSLTIPCVAGPYTAVNCTLTLISNRIRFDPSTSASGSTSGYPEKQGQDSRFIYNLGSTAAIATSHAQDDSGVFSVNFRDERYLPFETAGAVSRWMITMPPACNGFDFDTITDVVFKLSYTARYGGDALRGQAFTAATLPALPQQTPAAAIAAVPKQTDRDRLFSVKHEFPSQWYALLHPESSTAAYGQMPLWITSDRFPFQYRGRQIQTADIEVFALLQSGATLTSLEVYLTPAGPPPASPGTPPPAPTPDTSTDQLTLKNQSLYGTTALYGVKSALAPTHVPQLWWLSLGVADISDALEQVDDFFVLFHYSVA